MTIMHRGFAYAADDLSKWALAPILWLLFALYMARAILKLRTRTLLAQLEGLFDTALTDNVTDVSQATAGAGEANFITLRLSFAPGTYWVSVVTISPPSQCTAMSMPTCSKSGR